MDIDTLTGLPELPEDQYWEVSKETSQYSSRVTYRLLLVRRTNKLKLVKRRHSNDFLAAFGFTQWYEPQDEIVDVMTIQSLHTAEDEADARAKAKDWGYGYQVEKDGADWVVYNQELDKTNILATAKRIKAKQDRKAEVKAAEAVYIGTYPPRSIK